VRITLSPFLDEAGLDVAFRRGHVLGKALAVARGFAHRVRDVARVPRYDALIVYRESTPFGPSFVEAFAARCGVPVILDFDEALFVPNIHPVNRAWAWLRDPRRLSVACRAAAAVTAQNEYLASFARQWNRHVTVVPTPVDTEARRPRQIRAAGPIVVGWIGSETTAPYLRLIDDALAQVSSESDVIVRVVGGAYSNARVPRLEVHDFSLERERSELEGFDIGLLPEPDDAWTRGKGGYKALLYMAAGIPVIASRVGVNPDIVADGETGFCVITIEEWVTALRRLIDDAALRDRLGAAGRARVVEGYSIDVIAPRFAGAIREASRA
jgi:glycosyltransferase involved in cell wall biosynthesis